MREMLEAVLDVLASGQRGALATVVRVSGSTPQTPGARLLLRPDGSCLGTVGGGAVEQCVLEALRAAQRTGEPQLLTRDLGYDLGMCCGGRMEIFVEPVEAAPRLWLFGAGHVAEPTAALARSVGFEVHVVDEREEWNSEQRFPGCERQLDDPAAVLASVTLGERDWVLIVTHDHRLDEETLDLALRQEARYVGLVGSRRKTLRLVERITAKRGSVALDRLYAPVGLDLGAATPQEIAVSIAAELVALRRGRPAQHLRSAATPRLAGSANEAAERKVPGRP